MPSLAWTLAKVDTPAKPVDQDTSSAGRPAERSAADTAASADKKEEREDEPAREVAAAPAATVAPGAAAAPHAAAAPAAPPSAEPAPSRGGAEPPPPPLQPATEAPASPAKAVRAAKADADGLAAGGGGASTGAIGGKAKLDIPVEAYQKCVPGGMTLKLTLKGTVKGTTYTVTNGVKLSADVKACIAKVTAGVHLPPGQHSDLEVSK